MNDIKLCDFNTCTQCSSCISVCPQKCITRDYSKEGFFRPLIDDVKCVKCGLCLKSCHILNLTRKPNLPINTFAAWTNIDEIRAKSSSGGVFSELAMRILDLGGVVVGASYQENLKVKHIIIDKHKDIELLRGSKYVQSEITSDLYSNIRSILKQDKMVLFSGTPCQVSALYSFLKKDYSNLLTVDLVCHGTPSQLAFDIYLNKIKITPRPGDTFSFRYTQGWGFSLSYKGKSISQWKSFYLKAFNKNLMFNESCYSCRYSSSKRVGDITIGDFWGIGTTIPFLHSTQKGISLLQVNTEKGGAFVDELNSLTMVKRPLQEALNGNHNLNVASFRPVGRNAFYDDLNQLHPNKLILKYKLYPSIRDYLRPIKRLIRSLL